jgi:hypothetical protein
LAINFKTAKALGLNAIGHRRRGDSMMRRRQFIAGLGSAATWPVVASAQQPAVPVIGLRGDRLGSASAERSRFNTEYSLLIHQQDAGHR